MRLLIVGAGGREHALAYKLAQSTRVDAIDVAPGNAGTATEPKCRNIPIAADDIGALLEHARLHHVGLTIVGPEKPLVDGIVDRFEAAGLAIFGPRQAAAELEGSKAYAKAFMQRHGIPTAPYASFETLDEALAYVATSQPPLVIKADGLAAGKGVVICASAAEAAQTLRAFMSDGALGGAGRRVVIEAFVSGEEASLIVLAAGTEYLVFPSSQDHKRVGDGDRGPNTGGMGAYSPAPVLSAEILDRALRQVIEPTLKGLASEGRPFRGFLYAGLMIGPEGELNVLEFNTRLGDPETQPLLYRLDDDLLGLIEAALAGRLKQQDPRWNASPALGVVLAAPGYPDAPILGGVIEGLAAAADVPGVKVFHAGTRLEADGSVCSSGGRVLCVTARAADLASARDAAHTALALIHLEGAHWRRDIAARALPV